MANSKITDLPEAPSAATDDVLVIVDVSADETKKIKTETLKTSLAITKADVGLSNADNTSDLNKPISTAAQSALDLKYDASNPSGFITLAEVPADAVSSVNTKVGVVVLDKSDIGLSEVDNTSDADKPISTATQLVLDSKYDSSNPAGYITLSEVPAAPVTSVNSKVGIVSLDKSDIGLDEVDNTSDADKPISTATQTALNLKANSSDVYSKLESDNNFEPKNSNIQAHISSTSNPHNVTKSQVGLSNVDNTSDLNKPISTATQTALNSKEDSSNKGALNGYAPLVDGLVPSIYLPSYVDQVVEVADYASLPNPGEVSVIYITLDDHKTYRWSGSTYIEVSPSDVSSVNGHTGIVVLTKSDIGLSNVNNTSDADKPVSTATLGALEAKANSNFDNLEGSGIGGYILPDNIVLNPAATVASLKTSDALSSESQGLQISSGSSPVISGEIRVESGDAISSGNSGDVIVKSGNTVDADSGDVSIETGITSNGGSGRIYIQTGTPSVSGVRGYVQIDADYLEMTGKNIKNVADPVDPQDAVTLNFTQTALSGKIGKSGDSVDGPLEWQFAMTNGINTQTFKNTITADEVKVETYWNNANPSKAITIRADSITATTNGNPSTPIIDSELVNKKYVDDGLNTKANTVHTHSVATTSEAGFMSTSDKTKLDNLSGKVIGPCPVLSFSNTLFQNSGYVPGVTANSTPSSFGFYPVQSMNFIFNPFLILGANKNYRIRAIRRQTGAFNDGTHCMIRQVIQGSGEVGVSGLLDFGAGNNEYAEAISSTLTSESSSTNIWYRVYFASYNGGNGATVQDVTLYLEEVI